MENLNDKKKTIPNKKKREKYTNLNFVFLKIKEIPNL